jgi:excisionase family DNA binding protein
MESDEILTTDEVAALLKINPKTVYKFLKANELQGHRFGRIWRFKKSDIMKLLGQSSVSPPLKRT